LPKTISATMEKQQNILNKTAPAGFDLSLTGALIVSPVRGFIAL